MGDSGTIDGRLTAADILKETLGLIGHRPARVAIATAAMIAAGTASDVGAGGSGVDFLVSALSLAAQYILTAALLDDLDLRSNTGSRFLAFFGLGIVTTLAIGLGLILFVVPGIMLLVRWSIAVPAVIATDDGVFAAMQTSWDATSGRFWPILIAFLVIYGTAGAGVVAVALLESFAGVGLAGTLAINLFVNAGLIVGWHVAIAVYRQILFGRSVSEVFA